MFMLISFCHYVINFDKKYYIMVDKEFARGLFLDARVRVQLHGAGLRSGFFFFTR
jgi:hypothetical protein